MTPPALERLVRYCMAKEREDRIQSAHDVKLQLEWIAEAGSQAGVPAPVVARRRVSQRLAWVVAAVAVAAAAIAFAIGFVLRAPVPARPLRVSILPPEQHCFRSVEHGAFARRHQAGVCGNHGRSGPQLWVRSLDSTAAQPLAGTEDASFPFWSPDSRSLGFFAQGKLRIIEASGGAVQTLADAPQPRGGAWGADGTILYTPDPTSALLRIPAAGGTLHMRSARRRQHATLGSPRWPAFLPDGRHFIFFQFAARQPGRARGSIHLGALDSQQDTVLVDSDYRAQYASGHLVFVRDGNLMTQEFDEKKLKLTGNPVPIAEQIRGERPGSGGILTLE